GPPYFRHRAGTAGNCPGPFHWRDTMHSTITPVRTSSPILDWRYKGVPVAVLFDQAKRWLHPYNTNIKTCCQPMGKAVILDRYGDGSVRPANVKHCGLIWGCPISSIREQIRRAFEFRAVLNHWWATEGCYAAHLVLTCLRNERFSLPYVNGAF